LTHVQEGFFYEDKKSLLGEKFCEVMDSRTHLASGREEEKMLKGRFSKAGEVPLKNLGELPKTETTSSQPDKKERPQELKSLQQGKRQRPKEKRKKKEGKELREGKRITPSKELQNDQLKVGPTRGNMVILSRGKKSSPFGDQKRKRGGGDEGRSCHRRHEAVQKGGLGAIRGEVAGKLSR